MGSINQEAPQKSQITFGKFENVDMRVARIVEAPEAEGTRFPCRVLKLDLGHLGIRTSVGQYALVPENELVGRNVIACVNLGQREMGKYRSEALVLGAPHPANSADQSQATPLWVSDEVSPGSQIF